MGKAVPRLIKQRASVLIQEYPEELSKDFRKNKEFIKSLELPFSKVELNLMSGFITRKISGKAD